MAFCSKCGAKLEDGTKFCGTCGAEQEVQEASAAPEAQAEAPKTESAVKEAGSKNSNKIVGIAAFAVVAVIAIVLVVSLFSALFGGSYKKPLKTIQKAVNGKTTDIDDYLDVLPKFVGTAYEDSLNLLKDIDKDIVKDIEDDIKDSLDSLYEDLEDEFGKKVKLSYEITDKEKLDKDDREDIEDYYSSIVESFEDTLKVDITDEDELEDLIKKLEKSGLLDGISSKQRKKIINLVTNLAGELDDVKISKGYILTVEVTLEGKDSDDTEEIDLYVVKMNGKWCIEPLMTCSDIIGMDVDKMLPNLMKKLYNLMF